jgi:hypothetical protein
MLSLDFTTLQAVADKALLDAAAHPRWIAAIGRALVELDTNPFIERSPEGHGLIIGSTSGKCYSANGVCSCTAYQHGQPCYHRAMARLVRLHDERLQADQQLADSPCAGCAARDTCETRAPLSERLAKARREMAELFA